MMLIMLQRIPHTSPPSVLKKFLKAVGDFFSDQIITDLIAASDFTIRADESTDEADRS